MEFSTGEREQRFSHRYERGYGTPRKGTPVPQAQPQRDHGG